MTVQCNSPEKTVAIGWVRAILAAAARAGVDRSELLFQSGLGELPSDPLARIGLDQVVLLWRAAAVLTGDPAFGLRMGQSIGPASFNVISYIMVSSTTLREAFEHLHRFQRLVSDGVRLQLVEQNGYGWLVFHPVEAQLRFAPMQTEAMLSCAVGLLRWIVGPGFAPDRIALTHGAASAVDAYRETLGCTPEFGAALNAIGMPTALLDELLPARNPELCSLHESLARRHLAALSSTASVQTRVSAVVRQMLSQGMVQKDAVAALLGLSARTLQQRLAEEGTSFAETLDRARHQLALEYMNDPMLSFNQIAVLLGFSDTSAFYRAFKRWCGVVPGQYRRNADTLPIAQGMHHIDSKAGAAIESSI